MSVPFLCLLLVRRSQESWLVVVFRSNPGAEGLLLRAGGPVGAVGPGPPYRPPGLQLLCLLVRATDASALTSV
jgi:hypothetical protein